MGDKTPNTLSLGNLDPHLIHQCLEPPHSPPQMALLHNYTTKSHWLQWDAHVHPQNCPFLCGNFHPYILSSCLDLADLPPQRHPDPISHFATIHRTDRHKHRPTDGPDDKTCTNTHLRCIDCIVIRLIVITATITTPIWWPFFWNNLGKLLSERQYHSGF